MCNEPLVVGECRSSTERRQLTEGADTQLHVRGGSMRFLWPWSRACDQRGAFANDIDVAEGAHMSPVLRQRSRGGQIVDRALRDFAAPVLLAGLCGGMLRGEVARVSGGASICIALG